MEHRIRGAVFGPIHSANRARNIASRLIGVIREGDEKNADDPTGIP